MKKSAKGAIAAAAAGVLLLGGAGSLAFWSDSSTISGGEVVSGTLALSDAVCGDDWVYATGNARAGEKVNLIVPGDSISKACTFNVTATGDNLTADLTTPAEIPITTTDSTTFTATVAAAYTIEDVPAEPTITSDNNGNEVTATITATFPFGDKTATNANDTQGVTATLDAIDVTLVQSGT